MFRVRLWRGGGRGWQTTEQVTSTWCGERERGWGRDWREEGRERQTETKKRTELNMFTVVHWATIIYVKELMNAASEKRLTLLIRI